MTSHICIVPSWYPSAQNPIAGIFILQQAQVLAKAGYVTSVLFVEHGSKSVPLSVSEEEGILVARITLGFGKAGNSFFSKKIAGLRKRYNSAFRYAYWQKRGFIALAEELGMPDVVHVHALWPAARVANWALGHFGIPYVVTEHSEEYLPETRHRLLKNPLMLPFFLRPLAKRATRIIAVSRHLANRLEQLGLGPNIYVVPNVVPAPGHDVINYPDGNVKQICHVSQLGHAKNIELLLRACAKLAIQRKDFKLCIVGDGEERSVLEQLATELGIMGSVVEFKGRLTAEDVVSKIEASCFGVISSIHETFSVFAAECLMNGRPVLSTRCGGPEEFLNPSVGKLVKLKDIDALCEGMNYMLDNYVSFEPWILQEYALGLFAPEAVVALLDTIYDDAQRKASSV